VLEIVLENGRLTCKMVHVRGGANSHGLDTATMRGLNLTGLIDATAAPASFVRAEPGDNPDGVWQGYTPWHQRDEDELSSWLQKTSRTPRRGKAISDAELRRVAEIYRTAVVHRTPPTKKVATEMHVARSTAGRWVVQARKRGFLGAAPTRGKAGEATPASQKAGRKRQGRVPTEPPPSPAPTRKPAPSRRPPQDSESTPPKPQRRRKDA
jgi:hypothetical protein